MRLADVGKALAVRTYATDVDVVLGIEDDFLPWNAGNWHLSGGPEGATCEKTDRQPDLVVGVRELGTVYLGKPSLALLGAAGLVEERTQGALAATSPRLPERSPPLAGHRVLSPAPVYASRMQPSRRSALVVAVVLMLGVAAVALVVLASAGGSVRPVSESTLSAVTAGRADAVRDRVGERADAGRMDRRARKSIRSRCRTG